MGDDDVARDKHRNSSLADLALLLGGLAFSLGVARWYMLSNDWRMWHPQMLYNVHVAASFVASLSILAMIYAMYSVPPRRWTRHPAIVVGLSLLTLAVVDLFHTVFAEHNFHDVRYTGQYTIRRLVVETVARLILDVPKFALVLCVVGRFRRPTTWLEAMGWLLALCWMAVGVAAIVYGDIRFL